MTARRDAPVKRRSMGLEALTRIAEAGRKIADAETVRKAQVEVIVDELIAAGDSRNVEAAAETAGVGKSTLYRRINARGASS